MTLGGGLQGGRGVAVHFQEVWAPQLRALARLPLAGTDLFLMDYYPRLLERRQLFLPYARQPPRAQAPRIPLAT